MKFGFAVPLMAALLITGCGSSTSSPKATSAPTSTTPNSTATDPQATATVLSKPRPTAVIANASAFEQGKGYLNSRNYRAAEAAFFLSIKQRKRVADSNFGLGDAALSLQDFARAYRAFKTAATLKPKNPSYVYYTAYAALYAQEYSSSVSYASRFVKLRPKDARGYHLRFLAYGKLLRRKPQLQDARTIVRLVPKSPDGYNDLGIALDNNNKIHQAISAFTEAIRLKPSTPAYYINRAIAENLNKKPSLVIQDLRRARSLARDVATRNQLDAAIHNYLKTHKAH